MLGTQFFTASINLEKPVVPDIEAKCLMATQLLTELVADAKKRHLDTEAMLYSNALADAKAECYSRCCTTFKYFQNRK